MSSFGILGGQGAVATMQLHKLIVNKAIAKGAKQDSEFPSLLIANISSTSLSEHGVNIEASENIHEFITKHASIFNGNVDKVVAACNTIHIEESFLIETFGENVFVSIIELAVEKLPINSRVLLLCSETTKEQRLFETKDNKHNTFIYPSPEHSLALIENGMVNSDKNDELKKTFTEIMTTFEQEKCDVILLACTEMSIFKTTFDNFGVIVYDSLEILAEHIITETKR